VFAAGDGVAFASIPIALRLARHAESGSPPKAPRSPRKNVWVHSS